MVIADAYEQIVMPTAVVTEGRRASRTPSGRIARLKVLSCSLTTCRELVG